jgi:hypothetical protein
MEVTNSSVLNAKHESHNFIHVKESLEFNPMCQFCFIHYIHILEQVNTLTYLGCKISYKEGKGITLKRHKFLHIFGILNNFLKPNFVPRQSQLKF